mgnify:CR=1 FL=1
MNNNIRSIIEHMAKDPDQLNVLRAINNKTNSTQREMANYLGFSLGKLNYVIKALKKKGHIKVKNFKNNKNKINYLYVLTPQGITTKTKLTLNFMRLKMEEYDELKKELRKK